MKKKLVALLLVALMLCLALVGCGDKKADEILANAKEYLEGLQQESITTTNTPGDYEVPGKLQIDGVNLTVEWSVNVENGVKIVVAEDGTVTVDVDEMAEEDIAYTLTAKIVYEEGKTIETSFEYVVPKFKELTWSEFQATEDDEPVVIKGVITGIVETSKENDLYLQDENGGYFAYALEKKPSELGLKIGMTVRVRGIKDTYYGVHQVAKPTVEILDSTIKTVKALDITKTFTDAKDLKADELIKVQSMLVTIKGATVLGQNASNDTYYDFTLGGKTAYVRISSSTSMLSSEDEKSFKAAVADNIGYSADITGLVSIYSGNIYIIPVTKDAFSNFKVINRTPAEQVEFVGGLLSVTEKITENATIELTTTNSLYKDVEITWALTENACATLNGNVLKVVLPDEACELTLTATIKSGEATATKTFKIKVNAMSPYVAMPIGKAPVVGEKYKFALKQKALGSTLYFTAGEIVNKIFLPTTTDATKAADVFLEAVEGEEGKYYLAYMDGAAKYYIDTLYVADSGKVGNALTIRPNAKYEYDEKIGTLTTTVKYTNKDNVEKTEIYYIGTYGTYDTFSSSLTSYATNATSYVAQFCTVLDVNKTSDEDKVKTEKAELTLPETVKVDGTEITLPEYGEYFIKVEITWALGEGVTGATIEDGVLTVNLEKDARNIKVIATIKHGDKTDTKEFTIAVDKLPTTVPQVAETVVAGTAYKLVYFQTKQGKYYYFNGTAGDYYGNMTAAVTDAVDVYKEEATGGYYIYFLDKANENAKTYVEAYMSGTHCNIKLTTEKPASVWFDHETLKVPMVTLGENTYFLGTYGDNTDLRPSHEDYLDDGNYITDFYTLVDLASVTDEEKVAEEKDKLSFTVTEVEEAGEIELPTTPKTYDDVVIAWAVTEGGAVASIVDGKLVITLPAVDTADVEVKLTATIKIGTDVSDTKEFTLTVKAPTTAVVLNTKIPYNFYMYQANDAFKKNLYFAGTTVSGKSYQLATTDNAAEAVQVWLEAVADVAGAYRVYFYDAANENAKTYIKVTSYGTDGGTIALTTEAPTEYFTYSNEFNTLVYKYDGNTIYLGGYNDKDFFSANNTSRITGNNATALGVSQYVAVFSAAPVVGVAYDLGMYNASTNVNYYFFGSMTGNYLATTDTKAVSVPVYAEAVDGVAGGFRLFFYDASNENAKTYIRTYEYQDNKGGVTITTTLPTEYYTFSNELGAIVCTIDDNTYYLGSYDANTYIRVSNISYITGDNASKVGVTQYISVLTAHDFTLSVPDAEKVATENADLSIKTEFQVEGEITLPTTGATYTDVTINWEVADNNGALKLEEGKLIATPQATETTVKVSAIISLNEEEVTKVFDVVVAKKVVLIPTLVTAPVAGGSYYMGLVYEDAYNFLDGSTQNNYNFRLLFTQVYAEMIKFELEETTGGFYLKTTIDEAAKYLNIVKVENNGNTYVNTLYQDTAASVWTWSETYKTLTVTVEGMGEYAITQTGTYNNVEAKTVSTTGVKVQLFNIVDADTISHSDRVAMEKDALDVETTIVTAGDVTLPATGSIFEGVTVTWAVVTNDYVTLNGNVITVTLPAVDTTVVLTATISSGDPAETTTKEITLTVKAPNPMPIADVLAENAELASGSTSEKSYIVEGVIYNLVSDYYGNAYIVDENGTTIYVYGLVVDGTEYKNYDGTKVVVGDKVKLYSTVNNYNGTLQLKNAALLSTTLAADVTLNDAEKAVFAADALTVASKIEAVGDTTLTSTNETYGATVVWTVAANDYATVTNNVLTVATLPETSANITLTATVTVGEKTATKTLTVTLATPITIVQVDAATVAAEAKANATDKTSSTFYLFGTPVGDEQLYVTGSLKNKKLTLTNDANAAAKLYLVYVDTVESVDRFYLCFDVSGTRNYISWSSSTDFSVGTTAPTNDYWTVDTTNNTILCANSVRWLRTYNSSGVYDVRPYATTSTSGVDTVILGRVSTGA